MILINKYILFTSKLLRIEYKIYTTRKLNPDNNINI